MKALTIKQPFAELMFYDKIETRKRKPNYTGPVLICAGKGLFNKEELVTICGNQYERTNGIYQANKAEMLDFRGYAIGVGDLVNCRKMEKEDEKKCFVEYNENLYCWIFENVRRIKPIPFKGNLGLIGVSEEIIESICYI